jgi:hypothetical protein
MLLLGLVSFAGAAKPPEPRTPSPADKPTGILLMQSMGSAGPGDLAPAIKELDVQQAQWKYIGDVNQLIHMSTGPHQVGIVYSAGLNVFAAVKMVNADPAEEHVATAEISKDRITIVPFVIETSTGGFKWTLRLDGPHVVIPSRYTEGAVDEFIAILEDETLRGIPARHLGMVFREMLILSDARSIPALQAVAANPRYEYWKSTALGTIRQIERQNRRKKR